jgi:AraC-like DNA-binding protein
MENWLLRISPCLRIVGNEPAPCGWLEAMRVIYDHELVVFTHSDFVTGIVSESEIRNFLCPSGSFIIVPPGVRHVSREAAARNGHRYWVHFDWEYSGDYTETPLITYYPARPQSEYFRPAPPYVPAEVLCGRIKDLRKVLELLERLDFLWNSDLSRDRTVARGLLLELLLELLAPEAEENFQSQNTSARLASRARHKLNKMAKIPLRDAPTVKHCLERDGITYAHQCRVFKKHYGITPLQYVNELRMAEIKHLLHDTGFSISEIAEKNGYDNPGYFSRAFRKYTGMSPREYRNSSV